MGWTNSQFTGELTIPTGATTGQRITINKSNDGAIKVYDASNTLIAEISASADVIKALDAGGSWAKLDPNAVNSVSFNPAPGLALSRPSGDVEPASITQYDDGFDHGLYIRSSAPVADGGQGLDFSAIQMVGRYSTDPNIILSASGANSFVAINDTVFDGSGEMIAYRGGNVHTYTPTVTGGGAATYTTRVGRYLQFGPLIWVNVHVVVNAAGSGGLTVAVSLPFEPDRGAEQEIPLTGVSIFSGGMVSNGHAVILTTGSGANIDGIRSANNGANNNDQTLGGVNLNAGSSFSFTGFYLAAV